MPRYLRAFEDDPTYAMSRREQGKLMLAAAFGVQKSRISSQLHIVAESVTQRSQKSGANVLSGRAPSLGRRQTKRRLLARPNRMSRTMWRRSVSLGAELMAAFSSLCFQSRHSTIGHVQARNGRARDMRPDFGIWLCGPMRHRSRTCSFALKNCCRNLSSGPNVAAFSWMSTLFRSSAPNGLFDGLIWPLKSSISAVRRRRDRRRPCQRRCAADMAVAIGHGMAGERGEVAGGLFELEAERAA